MRHRDRLQTPVKTPQWLWYKNVLASFTSRVSGIVLLMFTSKTIRLLWFTLMTFFVFQLTFWKPTKIVSWRTWRHHDQVAHNKKHVQHISLIARNYLTDAIFFNELLFPPLKAGVLQSFAQNSLTLQNVWVIFGGYYCS